MIDAEWTIHDPPLKWLIDRFEPGTLLKVAYGDGAEDVLLVGDINDCGGCCACTHEFDTTLRVVASKRIWEPSP